MLFLILIALSVPGTHNQSSAKAQFDDYAIITPRRIEWTTGKLFLSTVNSKTSSNLAL